MHESSHNKRIKPTSTTTNPPPNDPNMSEKVEISSSQKKKEVEVELSTVQPDIAFDVIDNPLHIDKVEPRDAK